MNSVDLVGRLTKDIDLKYTTNGTAVGTFNLAVNRDYTSKNGEREADFISCVIWRKAAENLSKFTNKGSLLGVQGRLQSRTYDNKEGQRVYATELIVDKFHLLESKNKIQGNSQNNKSNSNTQGTTNYDANSSRHYQPSKPFEATPVDIDDDDLPF